MAHKDLFHLPRPLMVTSVCSSLYSLSSRRGNAVVGQQCSRGPRSCASVSPLTFSDGNLAGALLQKKRKHTYIFSDNSVQMRSLVLSGARLEPDGAVDIFTRRFWTLREPQNQNQNKPALRAGRKECLLGVFLDNLHLARHPNVYQARS